jgi:hypothetical protein
VASEESFLTSRGGWDVDVSLGTAGDVDAILEEVEVVSVFTRLASGELGSEGG